MKKFLNEVIECIKYIEVNDVNMLKQKEDLLNEYFDEMDEKSKSNCINLLKGSGQESILILSYLLQVLKNPIIQTSIEEILLEEELSVLSVLNILFQLNNYLFRVPMEKNEKDHYQRQQLIMRNQVERIRKILKCDYRYVPYANRNCRKVILMCRIFLGETHAPTAKIINICRYLEKLGYEPCVLCTYMGEVEKNSLGQWYNAYVENCKFASSGKIRINYFGVPVNGYIVYYTPENFYNETLETLQIIKEYNPLFVLDVGGNNIFSCLAEQFTTVCSMACVKTPPLTTVSVITRYFQYTEAENKKFVECLNKNQIILDMVHVDELSVSSNKLHRKCDYGLKEDSFIILIAGNRLDDEISKTFQIMLHQVMEQQENVTIVFIGKCYKLQQNMVKDQFAERYKFIGEVDDFKGIMKIGDLFLNPPRQGGGTGAYYAIANKVPVLTLPNCDVAQVGDGFTCKKVEEMPEIIDKYIHDNKFMESQKEYCIKRTKILYGIDNVGNIKKFISDLKMIVIEKENINKIK